MLSDSAVCVFFFTLNKPCILFRRVTPAASSSWFATFENRHERPGWRAHQFQAALRKNVIHTVQANRFTGDTTQTAGATTTKHKERKLTEVEKKNGDRLPFFKKYEWLIGNNAFNEPTRPHVHTRKTVQGTGVCHLPTTVRILQSYFNDNVSKVTFSERLWTTTAVIRTNLAAIRSFSKDAAYLMDHCPFWKVTEKTIKAEWINTPLFDLITFRMNWAYFKRFTVRKQYDHCLTNISTGIYTNNTWYNTKNADNKYKKYNPPAEGVTVPSSEELYDDAVNSPYARFFSILDHEMKASTATIMNVTLRSTALPVLTYMYDPYISRNELSANMMATGNTAAAADTNPSEDNEEEDDAAPTRKYVNNHTVFTYHRYWALYYTGLLDRFIESHSDICRAMCKSESAYIMPLVPLTTADIPTLCQQYSVATQFQPFDEIAAKWEWTPIKGHQGSRAILAEKFPTELLFQYPFVYLYHTMTGQLPYCVLDAEQQHKIRVYLLATAQEVMANWAHMPLLPMDLLDGNSAWTLPSIAFDTNTKFLWTFLCAVGRLEQLKRLVMSSTDMSTYEKDFYEHNLHVRETGYLPLVRWMLTELLIEEQEIDRKQKKGYNVHQEPKPIKVKQVQILDSRVTEAQEFFNCDEIDFDGELDTPDFSAILHLINFWSTVSYTKKNPILVALQKALPFRSMSRVLSDSFYKTSKHNSHFTAFVTMFVMVSTMGLFRRSRNPNAPAVFRPPFSTLAKIDFSILQTPKLLFNFIHVTKSKLLIYMARETLVHAVEQVPHYREYQIIDWEMLEEHTWSVSNKIRTYLHHYKFWYRAPFNRARLNLEEEIQLNFEKKYNTFLFPQSDFLHSILGVFYALHIKHLDKVIFRQAQLKNYFKHLSDPKVERDADLVASINVNIRRTQLELEAITYQLPDNFRSIIWQTMIGKRDNIDIWTLIRQWITDADLVIFHRLFEEYNNYMPKKKLEVIASQFSLSAFTMIYYLLQTQKLLKRIKLTPISQEMATNIHSAMRNRKHNIMETQPMQSSVYNVHITFCCNRIVTFANTNSYGNNYLTYNRTNRYYACCRKKTKKTGFTGDGAGNGTDSLAEGAMDRRGRGKKSSSKKDDNNNGEASDDEEDDDGDDAEPSDNDEEDEEEEEEADAEDHAHDDDDDQTFQKPLLDVETKENRRLLRKIKMREKRLAEIAEATRKTLQKEQRQRSTAATLIDKTRTGKNATIDNYPNMVFKERRKIVCRLDADTKPLVCRNNPPVLTLNLQGYQFSYGTEYAKSTTYGHCPKCGDFHTISLKHYNNGQGYMCANCVQKTWMPSLELQRTMFCTYCGRHHFKNVHQGLQQVCTLDIGDVNNPVKLLNYCYADAPKYRNDYFYNREKPAEYLVFLDSYLNRHDNLVRVNCAAYFPFQNTVQETRRKVNTEANGFSWISFGKRMTNIPQMIDMWWPSLTPSPQ